MQLLRDIGAVPLAVQLVPVPAGPRDAAAAHAAALRERREVAEWLAAHPEVAWVNYPGLPDHPDHARAEAYLAARSGAIIGFGIKGGLEAARRSSTRSSCSATSRTSATRRA